MLVLLLSLLLLYIRLVILNKVDLILTKIATSIRCPNGKISYIGMLSAMTTINEIRANCSQPFLVSSDDSINVFTTNAMVFKCTNKNILETKFKLHFTPIHTSQSISPSSISIHNEKSGSISKFKKELFHQDYFVTIAEKVKLINSSVGKFHYTFYIWFVERDWIICRLDILFQSHPCKPTGDSIQEKFDPFCYYNV